MLLKQWPDFIINVGSIVLYQGNKAMVVEWNGALVRIRLCSDMTKTFLVNPEQLSQQW